jgi:hypothetical protein
MPTRAMQFILHERAQPQRNQSRLGARTFLDPLAIADAVDTVNGVRIGAVNLCPPKSGQSFTLPATAGEHMGRSQGRGCCGPFVFAD